jgi:succinate dehydrogenase/fumarate reductase flavoprotein subunit
VAEEKLEERVRERTVGDMIDAAKAAGAPVERADGAVTVETVAAITTTLGGLRIDERAQAAPGVFAAGADAGGLATGGYASGLAAALVFGRIAARSALEAAT